jgi:peptidoglycan/xylan/chitin deacetylase (PgdA/CDA1 family)
MMRVPGRRFVRRALRPLARTLFPGAVVLGYHRVADAPWDPLGLAVSPARFRSQVEGLKSLRKFVTLGELAAHHGAGERLDRYAVLTFDDGYADFAETVVPIAESLGVPATIFIATGYIGKSFWWEDIAALLDPGVRGPATLELAWPDGASRHYDGLDEAGTRAAAVAHICDGLACRGCSEIGAVIAQLHVWAGADSVPPRPGIPMSHEQLLAIARHPLVELGAHTVAHGCLGGLPPAAQRDEIERSKNDLLALAGSAVRVFSYPNGSYARETPGLVEALGFDCACTSQEAAFNSRGDRYRIPRIWARNADGVEFQRWLGQWVSACR